MKLIDADALHNVLRKEPRWIVKNGDKYNEGYTYDQVHFAIDDMPIIEERKTGRWMTEYLDGIPGRRAKIKYCSECCQVSTCRYNFCPNCGAKMKGAEDGSN